MTKIHCVKVCALLEKNQVRESALKSAFMVNLQLDFVVCIRFECENYKIRKRLPGRFPKQIEL